MPNETTSILALDTVSLDEAVRSKSYAMVSSVGKSGKMPIEDIVEANLSRSPKSAIGMDSEKDKGDIFTNQLFFVGDELYKRCSRIEDQGEVVWDEKTSVSAELNKKASVHYVVYGETEISTIFDYLDSNGLVILKCKQALDESTTADLLMNVVENKRGIRNYILFSAVYKGFYVEAKIESNKGWTFTSNKIKFEV